MEALMWRASNVVISYRAIRSDAGATGTQVKEKKQGQAIKNIEKSRLGEKSPAPATSGSGRSYTFPPLALPSARNLVPAPLRFLWFPSAAKNGEEGDSSSKGEDAHVGDIGDYLQDIEKESANMKSVGAFLQSDNLDQEAYNLAAIKIEPLTESYGADISGIGDLNKLDNANAAKRWIQNLLNVNFLKKNPKIEVRLSSANVLDNVENSLTVSRDESSRSDDGVESQKPASASPSSAIQDAGPSCGCFGCEAEIGETFSVDTAAKDPLSMLEVPHVNVAHDVESFSKFISEVPLTELRIISQNSFLSSLAYQIRGIKPGELARYHRMLFVTSSLDLKAEARAQEKAAAAAASAAKVEVERNEGGSEAKPESYLSPATAYALATAATKFLRSQKKDSTLRTTGDDDNSGREDDKQVTEETNTLNSESMNRSLSEESNSSDFGSEVDLSSDMTAFMRPVTSVVSAETETKQEVVNTLRSLHTSPCEWFACDDKSGLTRFFSIQGSESFASWQANFLFEPVQFEDSNLGVKVHRGVYETALGLYDQILPSVLQHQKRYGDRAKFQFTGHSLGGSLGVLLSLMLTIRGVVKSSSLLPVYTFGAPYVLCGGDYLLERLGLPPTHVQSVAMHRDIVPRAYTCNYPDHVAEVLKRVNGTFRDHTCLTRQRLLYAPMGQLMILQPDDQQADPHPLLPSGSGLYVIRHQSHNEPSASANDADDVPSRAVQVRAAQRAFLNQPHPLEILGDPTSYGSEGTISKHHDPRNYVKAVNSVMRYELRRWRRLQRERRRQLWWPLITADSATMSSEGASPGARNEKGSPRGVTGQGMCCPSGISHYVSDLGAGRATFPASASGDVKGRFSRYKSLIASQHVQIGLIMLITARMVLVEGFAVVLAWV